VLPPILICQIAEIEETHIPSHGIRPRLGSNDDDAGSSYVPTSGGDDIEQQATSAYSITSSPDPYSLKSGLKTGDDLKNLKKSRNRKQGAFYEKQNVLIGELLMPLDKHVEYARAEVQKNRLPVRQLSCTYVYPTCLSWRTGQDSNLCVAVRQHCS